MGVVNDFGGLAAARFMLGLAEGQMMCGRQFWRILTDFSLLPFTYFIGGLFPGLNFVLTTWYNRNEQNWAVSMFFAGATLAGAFGGIRVDYDNRMTTHID